MYQAYLPDMLYSGVYTFLSRVKMLSDYEARPGGTGCGRKEPSAYVHKGGAGHPPGL